MASPDNPGYPEDVVDSHAVDYGDDCPACGDVLGINAAICETCRDHESG